jgi:cbb3-type cytochrome oxidase subunit 3
MEMLLDFLLAIGILGLVSLLVVAWMLFQEWKRERQNEQMPK